MPDKRKVGSSNLPRSILYNQIQHLFGGIGRRGRFKIYSFIQRC